MAPASSPALLPPAATLLHPDGMPAVFPARLGATLMLVCALCRAAAAQEIRFDAQRNGEAITVTAAAEFQADRGVAWGVLSDYDHLAEFIPDMRSSRIVERNGNGLVVEQKGEFSFLFFRQPVEIRMAVTEVPLQRVVSRAVAGNLKEMQGRYELEENGAGLSFRYSGRFVFDFRLPPVIGMALLRRSMERQFRAMVAEILRRDALAQVRPQETAPK